VFVVECVASTPLVRGTDHDRRRTHMASMRRVIGQPIAGRQFSCIQLVVQRLELEATV
jgi:hypothetical protein